MPGPIIHALVAEKVLERLQHDHAIDLQLHQAEVRHAFTAGNQAPDMGLFPGAFPLLSELTHYSCSGTFASNLMNSADSASERAFAFGWLCHILADIRIHPIINQAVQELMGPGLSPYGQEMLPYHVRIEMGLDGGIYHAYCNDTGALTYPPMSKEWAGLLSRAYHTTYHISVARSRLLRSLKASAYYGRRLFDWAVIAQSNFYGATMPSQVWWTYISCHLPNRLLSTVLPKHWPFNYLNQPVAPKQDFLEAVLDEIEKTVLVALEYYQTEPYKIPDWNLLTGQLISEDPNNPRVLLTKESLARELACKSVWHS
jgi:hypothetical protein